MVRRAFENAKILVRVRATANWALGLFAWLALGSLLGCGAPPLTPLQRDAILQRIRDQGSVARFAILDRDSARGHAPDTATLAFVDSETAALVSDVAAGLRQ